MTNLRRSEFIGRFETVKQIESVSSTSKHSHFSNKHILHL